MICAWCPDFDPTATSNRGVSHGVCPTCQRRIDAEITAMIARRAMSETSQTCVVKDAA